MDLERTGEIFLLQLPTNADFKPPGCDVHQALRTYDCPLKQLKKKRKKVFYYQVSLLSIGKVLYLKRHQETKT